MDPEGGRSIVEVQDGLTGFNCSLNGKRKGGDTEAREASEVSLEVLSMNNTVQNSTIQYNTINADRNSRTCVLWCGLFGP